MVSLERLRAVRELEPALWRMHIEAGVSTRHVQRLARENGLLFAPDPGAAEQSQIGGNVATNAGGPHAFKYGVTGDWVTGLEAVLAPGELVAGRRLAAQGRRRLRPQEPAGRLRGHARDRTAVRLRLLPAPELACALVVFLATRATGCAAILAMLAAGVQPAALDFIDGATLRIVARGCPAASVPAGAGFALLLEVDGTPRAGEAARAELAALLGRDALELRRARPRGAVAAGATASTAPSARCAAARSARTSSCRSSASRRGWRLRARSPSATGCRPARGATAATATSMPTCS